MIKPGEQNKLAAMREALLEIWRLVKKREGKYPQSHPLFQRQRLILLDLAQRSLAELLSFEEGLKAQIQGVVDARRQLPPAPPEFQLEQATPKRRPRKRTAAHKKGARKRGNKDTAKGPARKSARKR